MPVVDPAASFRTWSAAAALLARCPVETWPGSGAHARRSASSAPGRPAPSRRCCGSPPPGSASRSTIRQPRLRPVFQRHPRPRLGASRHGARRADPGARAPGARRARLHRHAREADVAAEVDALVRGLGGGAPARRRRSSCRWASPSPAPTRSATMPLGLDGTRRSVIAAHQPRARAEGRRRGRGLLNLALLAGRMGTRGDWFDDRGWYMAKMPFAPAAPAGSGAPHRGRAGRPARPLAPGAGARPRQHALGRRDRRRRARRDRARRRHRRARPSSTSRWR